MSSILEALRELEGGDGPTTTDAEPWIDEPSSLRRALPIIVLAVVGASAGAGAFLWSRWSPTPATEPEATAVATALPPAAPAVPPPAVLLDAEPPRARVTPKTPAVATTPVPLEPPATRVAAREPAIVRTAVARPVAPARPRGPRPIGEPRVDVVGIGYSSVESQRVVSLRVNGGPTTTLHEGESAGGIQVQLILPGSIYVRHAGQIFAVEAGG